MERKHCITIAIVVAGLALCAGAFLFPRQLPLSECSEVYLQYRDVEGIDASFIKGFPLNDTVTVDVTCLTARDTATWRWLRGRFGFGHPAFGSIEKGNVFFRMAPKGRYDQPADLADKVRNDEIIGYGYKRTIEILHITDVRQFNADSVFLHNIISNKKR